MCMEDKKKMTQHLLMVSYGEQLHKCMLPKKTVEDISIGNSFSDTITFASLANPFRLKWDGETCHIEGYELHLDGRLELNVEGIPMVFYIVPNGASNSIAYDTTTEQSITFGANEFDDFTIENTDVDLVFTREDDHSTYVLYCNEGDVYHNFSKVEDKIAIETGDQLFFDGIIVTIGEGDVQITSSSNRVKSRLISLHHNESHYGEDYPNYHRSPRIIYREPEEKKVIAKPSSKPSKPSEQLMRTIIPPIVMIGALAVVSIFQPRGIYIIVMLAMTVTTVILSVTSYIKNSKQYRIDMKERIKSYKQYLKEKTKELYHTTQEQRRS